MRIARTEIGLYAGSKISQILKKSIEEAITSGNYLNQSDFIRDAIREKLQREGFLEQCSTLKEANSHVTNR